MSERTYSQVNTGISVREVVLSVPVSSSSCLQGPSSEESRRLATRDAYAFRQPRDQDLSALKPA